MKIEDMVKKTILQIAATDSMRLKGWRIYTEPSEDHPYGKKIAEDYDLKRIAHDHPELRRARIYSAEDYYGIIILRIRRKAE